MLIFGYVSLPEGSRVAQWLRRVLATLFGSWNSPKDTELVTGFKCRKVAPFRCQHFRRHLAKLKCQVSIIQIVLDDFCTMIVYTGMYGNTIVQLGFIILKI